MTNKQFTSVLEKATYTFDNRAVNATFDNEYFFLFASLDYPSCKFEIEFYVQEDKITLTQEQENELESFCNVCYNDNIKAWELENANELIEDFIFHQAHSQREESIINR